MTSINDSNPSRIKLHELRVQLEKQEKLNERLRMRLKPFQEELDHFEAELKVRLAELNAHGTILSGLAKNCDNLRNNPTLEQRSLKESCTRLKNNPTDEQRSLKESCDRLRWKPTETYASLQNEYTHSRQKSLNRPSLRQKCQDLTMSINACKETLAISRQTTSDAAMALESELQSVDGELQTVVCELQSVNNDIESLQASLINSLDH